MNTAVQEVSNDTTETEVEDVPQMVSFSEDVDTQEAPQPLPAGVYIGEIIESTIARSKKGSLYCKTVWNIGSDQFPADYIDGSDDGAKLSYFRAPLEDNAGSRSSLKNFCQAVGYTVKRDFDPTALLGLTARITVKHEPYNGRKVANIAKIENAE